MDLERRCMPTHGHPHRRLLFAAWQRSLSISDSADLLVPITSLKVKMFLEMVNKTSLS